MRRTSILLSVMVSVLLFAAMVSGQAIDIFETAPTGDQSLELQGLLLTWQRDPTTTMTIDWHFGPTSANSVTPAPLLAYKASGGDDWQVVEGTVDRVSLNARVIHRVELTGLEPDTMYEFQMLGHDKVYHFRTMPRELEEPIRFAAGGDTMHDRASLENTNRAVMAYDPDFIVWGGDLAYADGTHHDRWHTWFAANLATLVTEEGRVIPVLTAIGNHEVKDFFWYRYDNYEQTDAWRKELAPFFYSVLAFPGQPGYGVIDFGDYLSIFLLDSDHSNPIEGIQTEWLEQAFIDREHVTHKFPIYHVPGYPSVRAFEGDPFDGVIRRRVRELWVPLFEQHGIQIAFENHDHAYKRTVPIRGNQPHPEGIVFIGDGSWGVGARAVHDVASTWYLERAAAIRHGNIVTLYPDGSHDYLMVDEFGNEFDAFDPRPVVRAYAPVWSGIAPLKVAFSAEATIFDFDQFDKIIEGVGGFDIGAGIASYEWDFGDGHVVAAGATTTHTYTDNGVYEVRVRVTDTFGNVGISEPLMVVVGNTAPELTIENPPAGAIYGSGHKLVLRGSAWDEEDGDLADEALSWEVLLEGSSPDLPQERLVFSASGNEVELTVDEGQIGWTTDLSYVVRLTATDSEGLAATSEQRVRFVRLQSQVADILPLYSLKTTDDEDGEQHVVLSEQGDHIGFESINLTGQTMAFVRARAPQGALLELRLDNPDGDTLAIAPVVPGGWELVTMPFPNAVDGVHDLYVVVSLLHEGSVEINWVQLIGPGLP